VETSREDRQLQLLDQLVFRLVLGQIEDVKTCRGRGELRLVRRLGEQPSEEALLRF